MAPIRALAGSRARSRASCRDDPRFKIPHMGWNQLDIQRTDHPALEGLGDGEKPYAYFLHSYQFTKTTRPRFWRPPIMAGRLSPLSGVTI